MIISSLVAMNSNRLIGVNNDLPWKLRDDLEHFKTYSMHKPIIMDEIHSTQLEDLYPIE